VEEPAAVEFTRWVIRGGRCPLEPDSRARRTRFTPDHREANLTEVAYGWKYGETLGQPSLEIPPD